MQYLMLVMLLIWFLSALFSTVAKFFGLKIDMSKLSCGIVGYSGSIPADATKLKLLLLYNQDRGKDSTGWAVNDLITKDTDEVKKFLQGNDLITRKNHTNYSVIAHARNGSVGSKHSKELAHPFGMYKEKPNTDETKPYDVILAMNGTLSNPDLIAEKYGVEFKTGINSDTQILTQIIANLGVDLENPIKSPFVEVLKMMDGPATLVFYFPSMPNTLMVLKDFERTLYCYNPNPSQIYISSLDEPLKAIGARYNGDVANGLKHFVHNKLILIREGKIVASEEFKRTPLVKKINSFAGTSHRSANNSYYDRSYGYDRREHYQSEMIRNSTTAIIDLRKRTDDSKLHKEGQKGGKAYSINERYFKNGHPMNGRQFITPSGKIKSLVEAEKCKDAAPYFFINGYMCKDEKAYDAGLKKCSNNSGDYDLNKFKSIKLSEFINFFTFPALTTSDGQEAWLLPESVKISEGETLIVRPFLSKEEFIVKKSDRWTINNHVYVGHTKSITEIIDLDNDFSDVLDDETKEKTARFLFEELSKTPNIDPNKLYAMVRTQVWNINNVSGKLKLMFFEYILEIAVQYDILSDETAPGLASMFKEESCSGRDFINEISNLFKLLIAKMKAIDVFFLQKSKITKVETSTLEKIDLNKKSPDLVSEEEIIHSIKLSNEYYSNKQFGEDVSQANEENLSILRGQWVPDDDNNKELKFFYEAFLIVMLTLERIDKSELLFNLELLHSEETMDKDVSVKCNELYNDWRTYMKAEDVHDASVEKQDKNFHEEEFTSQAQELMGGIEELASNIDETNRELHSPKLEKLRTELKEVAKNMQEHALNN